MPEIVDYVRLAPFSLEELVDAANSLLRHRPRLEVSRRTVRYYVSEGVLPPPSGSPKFSRYGVEHLLRLVGARCLQDQGWSLERARKDLDRILSSGESAALEEVRAMLVLTVQESSESGPMTPSAPTLPAFEHASMSVGEPTPPWVRLGASELRGRWLPGRVVRKIPLGRRAILEVEGEDLERALIESLHHLQIQLKKLRDTS
jgi:DNA-binding transcriptional MerR regulator